MSVVIEVLHVMIAVALIGIVLIQKSEGGGLGIGGGGGGMSGFMTGRGQANLLTRTTAILVACLMLTSISLAVLHGRALQGGGSLLDKMQTLDSKPVVPPAPPPAAPSAPSVPLAK
jgi:preprotein translocase subunit SecG